MVHDEFTRLQQRLVTWQQRRGMASVVVMITLFSILASAVVCYAVFYALEGTVAPGGVPSVILPIVVPAIVAPLASLQLVGVLRTATSLIEQLADSRQLLATQIERAEMANARLEELARRDPLTGVLNRRGFDEAIFGLERASVVDPSLSTYTVVVLDVDDFKAVNDRHGHGFGDRVLVAVAGIMSTVSSDAIVARIGGDEFAAIYFGGADEIARLRAMATTFVEFAQDTPVEIHCSVGAAPHDNGRSLIHSMAAADGDLYRVKASVTSPE